MSGVPEVTSTDTDGDRAGHSSVVVAALTTLIVLVVVASVTVFAYAYTHRTSVFSIHPHGPTPYPIGVRDATAVSGMAPPGPTALAHFHQVYVTTFPGASLPPGWYLFTGPQAGSPGGHFGARHVTVHDGTLELRTFKDPTFKDAWVTGGVCQCGRPMTYGAFFVRSRVTGAGPNEVELLWPANNQWPPEIDFNETGGRVTATSSTIHWGPINQIEQRFVTVNMTRWHTWGVIWTRGEIVYTVDGQVWGTIASPEEIAHVPMTLDFEQRTLCALRRQCPTRPVSMDVAWVAEYAPGH